MNLVIMRGNLGRDPEKRTTTTGKTVTSFSLAISDRRKKPSGEIEDRTEWVKVVCWGNLAENCASNLRKGSPCLVVGRWRTDSWEKNGEKRQATQVVAQEVVPLSRKTGAGAEDADDSGPF